MKAREILREIMATKPDHARPYHAAGVMDMELNRFTSARAIFFKGLLIAGGGGFNFDRVKDGDSSASLSPRRATPMDKDGLLPLVMAWAICEWQLGAMDRARRLFRLGVRLAAAAPFSGTGARARAERRGGANGVAREKAKASTTVAVAPTVAANGTLAMNGTEIPRPPQVEPPPPRESLRDELGFKGLSQGATAAEAASSAVPTAAWVWHHFARFEKAQGNPYLAQHYISRSLQSDNRNPVVWHLWSDLARDMEDDKLATSCLREALELENILLQTGPQPFQPALGGGAKHGRPSTLSSNPLRRAWKSQPPPPSYLMPED